MEPYIPELQKRLSELDIFERRGNYVRACGCRSEASAFGSAIYQIDVYKRQRCKIYQDRV